MKLTLSILLILIFSSCYAQDTLYLTDSKSLRFEKYDKAIIPVSNVIFKNNKNIIILSDTLQKLNIGTIKYQNGNRYYEFESGLGQACKIKSMVFQYPDTIIKKEDLKLIADTIIYQRGVDYYETSYFINLKKDFSKYYNAPDLFRNEYFRIFDKYNYEDSDWMLIGVAEITDNSLPADPLIYLINIIIK